MKDTTLIFLLIAAGIVAALVLSKKKTTTATAAAAPQPSQGTSAGNILDVILGRAGFLTTAPKAAPALNAGSLANPAVTGGAYSQNNLSGIASLVSAGTGALSSLVNIGQSIFGKVPSPLGVVASGTSQPVTAGTTTFAGSIDNSSLSGGIDWPAASDWGSIA